MTDSDRIKILEQELAEIKRVIKPFMYKKPAPRKKKPKFNDQAAIFKKIGFKN